jgi:tetratricopeptide (TPR) repeat protein
MAAEPTALREILESIADGATPAAVSELAERLPAAEQHLLPHLRLVAGISELNRSIQNDATLQDDQFERRGTLTAGSRWGNLELLDKVGEGAFGDVWRARDIHLDAEVALKLLHTDTGGDALTSRLLNEGRALALLRHPNVITVHGIETRDGQVGLRMEFVRGQTLEALLRAQGPFSASEATAIGMHLCRALAAVHRAGLVHRDVKAQNVMREEGGRIVLMDLGSGQLASARAGGFAGTPLYLAPEILRGEDASTQSDIYSVGVLLYHLVTGEYPFRAKTLLELTDLQANGRPVLLQDARPDLPDGFVGVVDRALARRKEERFDSAGAMTQALAQAESEAGRRWWPRGWRRVALAGVLVSMLALAVAWTVWNRSVAKYPPAVQRIAVLAFTTVGSDNELELLSRGIPMEVTASLGQIGALKVVPWAFMKRFEPGSAVQTVADGTQADAIVEGTIQRASSADTAALQINIQVYRATTGTILWTQRFETRTGGVMALQAEIARRIAGGLRIALARREQMLLERFRNVPDDAVELYLKGREAYEGYDENFSTAIGYFTKVLEIDPSFADAHAALAECYALQSSFSGSASAEDAYARAIGSATQAIAINPELPEAYSARGFAKAMLAWDWAGAEADFRRALELDPHSAAAHGAYSNYLTIVGRYEAAIEESRIAEERAPLSPVTSRRVAWAYYMARRYHEAIEQLRHVLDMDPSYSPARTLLARAYVMVGWYDDAIREVEPVPKGFEAIAAQVYAQAGRTDHARELLASAVLPHNIGNPPYQIAAAFAALRDRDQALVWLERAFQVHDTGLLHLAQDPRLDPLRGDPRFDALLARLHNPRP